jgi:hypothetical protein
MHRKSFRVSIILLFSLFVMSFWTGCNFFEHKDFWDSTLTASIVSPSSNITITEGDTVSFEGQVAGGMKPYYLDWSFDGADDDSTELKPGNVTFDEPGTYNVSFHVYDTKAAERTCMCVVTVQSVGGDNVSITNVSPSTNVTPDADTSFTITLDYTLNSADQGELSLSFNNNRDNYSDYVAVDLDSSGTVAKGSGTKTYHVTCKPLYWGGGDSFKVKAAITEFPVPDPATPLAYDYYAIWVNKPAD